MARREVRSDGGPPKCEIFRFFMKFFPWFCCFVAGVGRPFLSRAHLGEREKGVSRIRSRLSESAHFVSDDSEKFFENVTLIAIYSMYMCRWLNNSSMFFAFVLPKCLHFQSIAIPKIRLIRLELHDPGSEYPATVAEVLCEDCLGPRPRQRRPEGFPL